MENKPTPQPKNNKNGNNSKFTVIESFIYREIIVMKHDQLKFIKSDGWSFHFKVFNSFFCDEMDITLTRLEVIRYLEYSNPLWC